MLDGPMLARQGAGAVRATVPSVTASTPDALWASQSVRQLRPAAVVARDVRRSVHGHRILDGVTLGVPVGARLLLVSQPDAGAVLLLRVLAGLARADGGTIQLAGLTRAAPEQGGWARRVTYVGATRALPDWISPREALDLAARLLGHDSDERERLIDRAIERYGLYRDPGPDRPLRRGGAAFAERAALAAAMVGDPEVLLLDEPLRSVEPRERARLIGAVPRRTTVLLASRLPASEVGLVEQVALLRQGRVAVHAPVAELERRSLPLTMRGIEALAELAAERRRRRSALHAAKLEVAAS